MSNEVAIGPALNSYSVGLPQRVRLGLRLGLGKSLFPVGRAKEDQRLPAGTIATAYEYTNTACCFSRDEKLSDTLN